MHTDNAAAAGAPVFRGLLSKKPIHSISVYRFEVFNHTHAVAFAVAFVQVGEVLAGYCAALAAGLELVLREFWAAFFYVAVFGSGNAASAVGDFAPFSRHPMRVSQVSLAYAAVHAAWSNKVRGECRVHTV